MTPPAASPRADAWASNATLDEIAAALRATPRIAVLTHAKPDGDAIGSTLAVSRALATLGIEALPVYTGIWSPRFDPVIAGTRVIHEKHGDFKHPPLADIEHALILDTGSWNQLADCRAWLEPRTSTAIVIDHHAHGDPGVAARRYIDTKAAAACQIAAALCARLLGVPESRLPREVAEPLMLGLATDTGWFRHSSTTAAVLRLAADLVEAGARHNWLYQTVEQGDEASRLKVIARALASLEFVAHDRAVVVTVTQRDLKETGGTLDDTGGLTDLPQTVASVRVAASVVELEPALTKVSFRSKAAGAPGEIDVDVNKLAQTLGGGGHRHAAGAKIHLPLSEAMKIVRAALTEALK